MRRAVRISLRLSGELRANSRAVERPIPEEAPVMRMVLPERRFAVDILVLYELECRERNGAVSFSIEGRGTFNTGDMAMSIKTRSFIYHTRLVSNTT